MSLRKTMKKSKIRQHKIKTRIMLLSLALSAGLLAVLIPVLYFSIQFTTKKGLSDDLDAAIESVAMCLYADDNGKVRLDKDLYKKEVQNSGVYVIVTDEAGETIYESFDAEMVFEWLIEETSNSIETAADSTTNPGVENILNKTENGIKIMTDADNVRDALNIDKGPSQISEKLFSFGNGWSRLSKSCEIDGHTVTIDALGNKYYNKFMQNSLSILYFIAPAYLLLAAIGSRFIAKDALKPISEVTGTARSIKSGDMSKRIDTSGIYLKDEVGELATTFNEMIDEIEVSIKREKQFTSDASHELRTPVSVISACVDEAMTTKDEKILKENLEMIQNENNKMTKIISQLLMLSRGYEGRHNFEPEQIGLKDMVDSVAEVINIEAQKREITITNNVGDDVSIVADQSLFTQIMMNIVGNAVKYGKDGGHINISSENDDKYIWTVVSDDGIGIAQEDLGHIFERFYRADAARDRNGSGLGLAIVKWIVELHKGQIEVNSKPGEGTEFRIGIPVTNSKS